MAEIFLSSFLQVLFDKLFSHEFIGLFRGRKVNEVLLLNLKMELISVSKLLEGAEDRQLEDTRVEEWLDELKDAVYDAEDILDEIATEALQVKLDAEFQDTTSKVRNCIFDSFRPFAKTIEPKIKQVLCRLKDLAGKKNILDLKEVGEGKTSERCVTTSLVEQSETFGRDDDKEKIINLLLSNDGFSNKKMRVVAIVGMGGIGKTTLAQLVYNDERVKEYFDLQAWVYVSGEFDVHRITKTILGELGLPTSRSSENLNGLQITLHEKLREKKFLIVLDDMWDENPSKWELLIKPFKFGVQGNAVIVTTRNESVASIMRTVPSHPLKGLSKADSWMLFVKHAFDNNKPDMHPELEVVGRKIVEKCEGLPLAVKVIGRLLHWNLQANEWRKILESNIWDLSLGKIEIHPSLRLSYKYLSTDLKRCFAYCSIFKRSIFLKEYLTLLWMAEGLLKENTNKTMEELGDEYFLKKLGQEKSFFGMEDIAGELTELLPRFGMHDLFSDLAWSMSGQFGGRSVGGYSLRITKKTRHLFLLEKEFVLMKKSKDLHMAKRLRTFFVQACRENVYITNEVLRDLFPMMTCLRVLSLRDCINVTELPESIVKMKHLRYLDLYGTKITNLPNLVCKLCNLQTLKLAHCAKLVALPKDMRKLVNLRHLVIEGTSIKEMPVDLGQLQCLHTLHKFVVSKHKGACIQTLGKLVNLQGRLSISDLQNIISPRDALEARLKDKKYIEGLQFQWDAIDTSESQKYVLNNLQPHTNLKSLIINNYCAKSLSNWIGHHSFSNIAYLRLHNCKYCYSLPSLGQLCCLRKLFIIGLEGILKVDVEFYGNGSSSIKPFEALKILMFEQMLNWEEWSSFGFEGNGRAFPQLEELYIISCPKLKGELPAHLPSLAKLKISDCQQLVATLPNSTTARDLELTTCNEVLLKELPTGLRRLRIHGFNSLECLPEVIVNCSSGLQELIMGDCMKLELSADIDLSSLKILKLYRCDSPVSFPLDLFSKLFSIDIDGCKNLRSLTISEQHPCDLEIKEINIVGCPNLVSFPKKQLPSPNLEAFCIMQCPEINSFPQVGRPCNLSRIQVRYCEKLFANRMEWGLPAFPSIRYLEIYARAEDVVSFPEPGLLPSCLLVLDLGEFQNLKSLDKEGLQHLTSLQELCLRVCPKLTCIAEKEFPASLSNIRIWTCPLLKKQLQSKKVKKQRKIPDSVDLFIDDEYIG